MAQRKEQQGRSPTTRRRADKAPKKGDWPMVTITGQKKCPDGACQNGLWKQDKWGRAHTPLSAGRLPAGPTENGSPKAFLNSGGLSTAGPQQQGGPGQKQARNCPRLHSSRAQGESKKSAPGGQALSSNSIKRAAGACAHAAVGRPSTCWPYRERQPEGIPELWRALDSRATKAKRPEAEAGAQLPSLHGSRAAQKARKARADVNATA